MNLDYKLIGGRIKESRKQNNKTQDNLAEFLDVSVSYVSRIERGNTKVSLETLAKICSYLNVSIGYILEGSTINNKDYLRNDILDMLECCSPDKIKLICEVIKPIIEYK